MNAGKTIIFILTSIFQTTKLSELLENIDTNLVLRLQLDDRQAFNELFWKYQAALYKNVYRLTKDAYAAEDIVQEVFINFWEQRKKMSPEKSISGWLFVVSYNKSVDHLKLKQKETLVQQEAEVRFSTDDQRDLSSIRWELLEKAVAQLSPQKRKVFELCKLNRKTYSEAAGELHLSKHTIKEYLSEATSLVKSFIEKHPESCCLLLIFS